MNIWLKYSFIFAFSSVVLSSCGLNKHLAEDELLLKKVKIKGSKHFVNYELDDLVQQNPNRTILGMRPYLGIYLVSKKFYDSTKIARRYNKKIEKWYDKTPEDSLEEQKILKKINKLEKKKGEALAKGNWFMRVVGEPPVIFDSSLAKKTTQQLSFYQFSKGFLASETDFEVRKKGNKVTLTYHLKSGSPYYLHATTIRSNHDEILRIMDENRERSLLKPGKVYKTELFTKERERLNTMIKDSGYFNFKKGYIEFRIDTTIGNHQFNVKTVINMPNDSIQPHFLREVKFDLLKKGKIPKHYNFHGFHLYTSNHKLAKRIARNKIVIESDKKYNLTQTLATQQNLANLNLFKFINISYLEMSDSTLKCYIKTKQFPKYQVSTEIGVSVFRSIPGPFGNIGFSAKNLLNLADHFEFNLQGLIEGQSSPINPEQLYRSRQVIASVGLTFPVFIFPVSIRKTGTLNPKTRIRANYNYVNRPEFVRSNISGTFSYLWNNKKNFQFTLSPMELTIINTSYTSEAFESYLSQLASLGNSLFQSFNQSIIAAFPFSVVYNNYSPQKNSTSKYWRLDLESGGNTLGAISGNLDNQLFGLDIFRYVKGYTDFRYYIPMKNKRLLATKISLGGVVSTGPTPALPYEKYFFTGGSYSNRAWLPRRLGQGSYLPSNPDGEDDYSYQFEQPGEFLIEGNLEYRFNIAGFLNGALFTDISNVWMLNSESRPETRLNTKFYNQFGIGAGYGLRFDFSFLVLRIDIAKKIFDPTLDEGDRWTFNKGFFTDPRWNAVTNLGIGYPF